MKSSLIRRITLPAVFLISLFSVAVAQTLVDLVPSFDLAILGASVLIYGNICMFLVESIKTRIKAKYPDVPGTLFTFAAFGVSLLGALILHTSGNLSDSWFLGFPPPLNWIGFGLVAGAIATGWYDTKRAEKKNAT